MATQAKWTPESMREFDTWMKQEQDWMKAEYTHVRYNDTRNADHAHRMRWRCMDLAVAALKEADRDSP